MRSLRSLGGLVLFGALSVAQIQYLDRPAVRRPRQRCREAAVVAGRLYCDDRLRERFAECRSPRPFAVISGDRFAGDPCRGGATRMPPVQLRALGIPVDINAAAVEELSSLPGIGPVLARRVVAERPYGTVGELRRVKGIGEVRLSAMRKRARTSVRCAVWIAAAGADADRCGPPFSSAASRR